MSHPFSGLYSRRYYSSKERLLVRDLIYNLHSYIVLTLKINCYGNHKLRNDNDNSHTYRTEGEKYMFREVYATLSTYSNHIPANKSCARGQGIEVSTPVSYSGRFRCRLLIPGGAVADLIASACWRVAASRRALQATHQAQLRRGRYQRRRKEFSYTFRKLVDVFNSRKQLDVLLSDLVKSTFCEPLLSPMVLFKWNISCVVSQMRHIRC
jgi:hypothetical protein